MKPSINRNETAGDFAPKDAGQRVLGELAEQRATPREPSERPTAGESPAPQKHTGQIARDAFDDLH